MEHYRIKKQLTTPEGNTILVTHGVVALTDDAHGADRYVELKRQGYKLERLPSTQVESP
jgi:hypothetical protein